MCQIVSIHSFRGGTGKSNLVANVAATIASQGKNVGVVDTDIQSPGIHILFGLDESKVRYSLNDYLWGNCSIQDTAYNVSHVFRQQINSNIYLIPSSIKAGQIARILREGYDVGRLNDGFQKLIDCLNLDYLLIDTHPGLNEETLLSIAISDTLVVLLRPDKQDFQGTGVTVDVARKLQVPKMLMVANKVLPEFDFDALRQDIETTYDATLAGIIPLSAQMVQLASSGIFCLQYPDHSISKTVTEISSQIIGERTRVLVNNRSF